ncbi:hypothetical protein Tco_0982588 [Tanacetum coccineum]
MLLILNHSRSQLEVHGALVSKEDINQKFLRSLPSSWNQIALIMRNKPDIDEIDIDDLYNKLRNTGSTNELSTASGDFGINTAGGINQVPSTPCAHDVAMLTVRVKKFIQRTGRNMDFKEKRPVSLDKSKIECYNSHRKGHFARERKSRRNQGRRSYDDNGKSNAPTTESSSQALNYDTEREKHNKAKLEIEGLDEYAIRNKIIESQTTELNTKTSETAGKTNDANTEKPKSVSESVVSNPKINKDSVIIEDWNSDDEEEGYEMQTVRPETQIVKTRDDKSGQTSKKQGIGFKKVKACFVCKSTDHLIKDCNFHDKKSQEPKLKNVVNTGQREGKPVWDNTKRVNHQNFSKYPHLSKTFVPSGVLTRTGFVSTARPARPSISTARPSISTARPVCTVRPSISTARPSISTARPSISTVRPVCTARLSISAARPSISTARPVCTARSSISTARPVYASRPIYPRMDNVRPRGSCSPIKRSYYTKPAFRPKDLKQDVKTFGVKNMTTTGKRAVVNISKVVDSGCSSHMTGNKAYLSDYEDFNEGFVAFGSDLKEGKNTGTVKSKLVMLDFDDVIL